MTEDLHFAPLSVRDLDAVMAIEHACHTHPWTAGNFADSIAHEAYACTGLFFGGSLLGYSIVCQGYEEAHLLNICVAPAYRGQRFGVLLLQQLLVWMRQHALLTLWLEVRVSNARAQQLYRHFGMRQVGQRKNYYQTQDGGREDALLMRYDLVH